MSKTRQGRGPPRAVLERAQHVDQDVLRGRVPPRRCSPRHVVQSDPPDRPATVYSRGSACDERGGVVVADAPRISALAGGDLLGSPAALLACALTRVVQERR